MRVLCDRQKNEKISKLAYTALLLCKNLMICDTRCTAVLLIHKKKLVIKAHLLLVTKWQLYR